LVNVACTLGVGLISKRITFPDRFSPAFSQLAHDAFKPQRPDPRELNREQQTEGTIPASAHSVAYADSQSDGRLRATRHRQHPATLQLMRCAV